MTEEKTPNQINMENMQAKMSEINDISPSMCLAKWLQSTVYLMNGHTHSCHHPPSHRVPLEELEEDPSALHNTKTKKAFRQQMLEGERPEECQYCWNIEDLPGDHVSDRTYKSTDGEWAYPYKQQVMQAGGTGSIDPTYMEVAFENTCNFKCAYCSPAVSSKWMEEIKQHGAYPTSMKNNNLEWLKETGRYPIPNREENPYVDAFWRWWPQLYKNLVTFRITGGEPLLSKNTWRVLDEIKKDPRSELNFAVNSNMQVQESLQQRLIEYTNEIAPQLKSFDVYTSAEASGKQADYIRYGMDYDLFYNNVRTWLSNTPTSARMHYMVTFNNLSITTFRQFLEDIWNLRVEFNEEDSFNRIPMMISYVRWPLFMDAKVLPGHIKEKYIKEIKDFAYAHTRNTSPHRAGRFYLEEIDQIERLCEYMLDTSTINDWDKRMEDFRIYFQEYDKRRNTDFLATFPELREMYE